MKITSLTLHFFEPGRLALLFPRQKKKNPQPVVCLLAEAARLYWPWEARGQTNAGLPFGREWTRKSHQLTLVHG